MARIRTIKPAFFLNEQVASLPYEWRLLFVGLWTQADRDGRLEDRPLRLKAELFPYDNVSIEDGLALLARAGLIVRYQNDGRALIAIPSWMKHQKPHHQEAASLLPPEASHQGANLFIQEGKGREQEGKGAGSLTPSAQDVVDLWNQLVTAPIPKVTRLTADRRTKIDARLKEHPDLATWRTVIAWVNGQDWCRAPGTGSHPNWTATIDWLVRGESQIPKCLERAMVASPAKPANVTGITSAQLAKQRYGSKAS